MNVDNKTSVVKGKFFRFILAVFVMIICVFIGFDTLVFAEVGLTKNIMFMIVLIPYALYYLSFILRNVSYFSIERKAHTITVKHSPLLPGGKKVSFMIKLDAFGGVEIVNQLFGLRKYIIFYQKSPKGLMKFRPLSISGLPKSELEKLNKYYLKTKK
ncbi:MAG: hypothetical protein JXR58_01665 [Bacteroidales bacterium]|nr:hypothetical protein [Bacteroidales bacterium]